jgi:Rad3-related DNA helicase
LIREFSARRIAEFVCRRGDLYPPQSGIPVDADEGVRVQKLVQAAREGNDPAYRKEVALACDFELLGTTHTLKGRADGVVERPMEVTLEEYKCTRTLPEKPQPVDWGQAVIYGGLWAHTHAQETVEVSLVYVEPEGLTERAFSQIFTREAAAACLTFMLACVQARVSRHRARVAARETWSEGLDFPYPDYRPGQRAIARRIFVALKNRENLLLEAPTGSGKTMAILYPAVRAQQADEQLFFLTGRTSGARAALDGALDLDPEGGHLATVELTAKEKVCFVEGMPCDADACPYAKGYFDRAPDAVDALLEIGFADRNTVEDVARQHTVCPFEISLDAALWADLIVGDYNYAFDPVVRLQRFNGHPDLHLLIDEAHNLSPRAQDMLAVEIDRRIIRGAKASAGVLEKPLASIDRALMKIRRSVGEGEHATDDVAALERALKRFTEAAAEIELDDEQDALREALFAAHRWQRSTQWYDSERFVHLADVQGRNVVLRRTCLDPARHTAGIMAEHAGVVRFSGTVSPLPLYQRLHGNETCDGERATTPFDPSQAEVLIVRDVPTFYQARERSLAKLAALICDVVMAHEGRYLLALPSYAYLNTVVEALRPLLPESYGPYVQTPELSAEERDALLHEFADGSAGVLGVVMGGVLSESVDFSETSLAGVILVGIGLPPPSLKRNLTADYFERKVGEGWGQLTAYTQPAMAKIVQAAGRLIRSPSDRGVICLVDPRFERSELQQFFPSYWSPSSVTADQVSQLLRTFWQTPTIAAPPSMNEHEHSPH